MFLQIFVKGEGWSDTPGTRPFPGGTQSLAPGHFWRGASLDSTWVAYNPPPPRRQDRVPLGSFLPTWSFPSEGPGIVIIFLVCTSASWHPPPPPPREQRGTANYNNFSVLEKNSRWKSRIRSRGKLTKQVQHRSNQN